MYMMWGGDYNQTNQLMIALLCVIMQKYVRNIDDKNKKKKWIFAAGVCGSCMLLTKQPLVLANAIVFAIFLLYLIITKKEKNPLQIIISGVLGVAFPLGICFIYLGYNHAISEFIYQIYFDTSSKGSIFDIVIGKYINIYWDKLYGIWAIICFYTAYIVKKVPLHLNKKRQLADILQKVLIVISIILFCHSYSGIFIEIWNKTFSSGFPIFFTIAAILLITAKPDTKLGKYIFGILLCMLYLILLFNMGNAAVTLYKETRSFSFMVTLLTFLYFILVLWVFHYVIGKTIKKEVIELDSIVLACGGIASGYTTIMTNGEAGVVSFTAFISVPAIIYIIFRDKTLKQIESIKSLQIICLAIFSICLSQKLVCAYSWWGNNEAPYWEKNETSQIDSLKGFKFSKEERKKYDEIYNVIVSNSNKDSIIWGFPYVKVYNIFADNYNMSSFVPVPFYDVCADDYAIKEAELLSENNPDIIVWIDIPGCMETHELLFRNGGTLGQRRIQKWFSDIKNVDYNLIGQVDNVFVYKRKDGTEPTYTYIERKTQMNETSEYILSNFIKCDLPGEGTYENPYLIGTEKEFIEFRDLVNSGYNFHGEYVLQTDDIFLNSSNSWEPIGIFESEKLFEGTYNGNGFNIHNLYIYRPDDNVGLFGQLAGTVVNVSLVNCNITGACVGGIASHGINDAKIVNCSVRGNLIGHIRAGGIADNLSGNIINCIALCELEGNITAGISGYYTNTVINCYSNLGDNISIDDGFKYDSDTVANLNNYLPELKLEAYGGLLHSWNHIQGKPELSH